jgi:hypothetical protein
MSSLSLSKVLLLFQTRIKTPKQGNTEFRILTTDNPAQHVDRATVLWSSDLLFWHTTPPLLSPVQQIDLLSTGGQKKMDEKLQYFPVAPLLRMYTGASVLATQPDRLCLPLRN